MVNTINFYLFFFFLFLHDKLTLRQTFCFQQICIECYNLQVGILIRQNTISSQMQLEILDDSRFAIIILLLQLVSHESTYYFVLWMSEDGGGSRLLVMAFYGEACVQQRTSQKSASQTQMERVPYNQSTIVITRPLKLIGQSTHFIRIFFTNIFSILSGNSKTQDGLSFLVNYK